MGIECFVSAEALALHKEHLSALRTRKDICTEKKAADSIACEISAHTLYFNSFRRDRVPCPRIKSGYGSENRFCYVLLEYALTVRYGFLYIYPKSGFPYVGFGNEEKHLSRAALAIDLWEHAYFLDYGFDKNRYISNFVHIN